MIRRGRYEREPKGFLYELNEASELESLRPDGLMLPKSGETGGLLRTPSTLQLPQQPALTTRKTNER
jgi:hypothetical protein